MLRAAQERFYLKGRWVWPGQAAARSALRLAFAVAEPGLCADGDPHAGAGRWRQHGGLQRDECRAAASRCRSPIQIAWSICRTSNPPRGTGTIDSNETFSYPVYDALRKQDAALSPLMAYVPLSGSKVAVRYGAQPEEAEGDMVSGTFFSGLGVNLPLGRGFTERGRSRSRAARRHQLQLLDAALCARSRMCWERRCM